MVKTELTLPELGLLVGTRGMLGLGVGLLVAHRLSRDSRKGAGWTLAAVGALSTIPLAWMVWRGRQRAMGGTEIATPGRTSRSFATVSRCSPTSPVSPHGVFLTRGPSTIWSSTKSHGKSSRNTGMNVVSTRSLASE